ncbi:DUF1697 domain-containing protein [bacterium]|nr:DUF1697 domain-containing protein [bacterium]
MKTYIALIRSINVGGTGKLAMSRLREICEQAGFGQVRSYIQSGNLVLQSDLSAAQVKTRLEDLLLAELGRPHAVFVRTLDEMSGLLKGNPYPGAEKSRLLVVFFDCAPELSEVIAPDGEQLTVGKREVYVHYPLGLGRSRLKAPGLQAGTGRNLNTLSKLLELGREVGDEPTGGAVD